MNIGRTHVIAALAAGVTALVAIPSSASWSGGERGVRGHASSVANVSRTPGQPRHYVTRSVTRDPALTGGYCEVASGPAGDAFPEVAPPDPSLNMASLDLLTLGAKSDATNFYFKQAVSSLHARPDGGAMIYGRADLWEISFQAAGAKAAFVNIEYPGQPDRANPGKFIPYETYGYIVPPPAGAGTVPALKNIIGTAAGTVDSATDTITFTVPLKAFGLGTGAHLAGPVGAGVMVTAGPKWALVDPNTPPSTGLSVKVDYTNDASVADYEIGKGCISNQ